MDAKCELKPCYFCKALPQPVEDNFISHVCIYQSYDYDNCNHLAAEDWNSIQLNIEERELNHLREAFNIGHRVAAHGEFGSGPIDWRPNNSRPLLYGEDYGDEDYQGVDAFDFWVNVSGRKPTRVCGLSADSRKGEMNNENNVTKTIEYHGLLASHSWGDAENILFLSTLEDPLAEELEEKIARHTVSVRYWITDKQCTKEEAQMAYIRSLYGLTECDFGSRYSEVTGYLWTDEEIKIGGHDLIQELRSYIGKWLILEIDIHD